jgi:hypothetical protein
VPPLGFDEGKIASLTNLETVHFIANKDSLFSYTFHLHDERQFRLVER